MAVGGYANPAAVVAVCITMSTIAATAVAMRIYARLAIAKSAGWDDGFITFGSANSWVLTGIAIWLVETGMGKHESDLSYSEAEENRKALWTSIIIYNLGLTSTKMSILLQYQRIFPQKRFRIANWIMMGIVISYALWRFFSAIFACVPVQAYWDISITSKTCLPRATVSFASAGLNIAIDIAITILPLPLLNKLELPKRQKRILMAVFCLGGVVCIISILRLYALYVVWNSKDVSYDNGMAAIWSNLECNVGIICSCLPTLRRLFPKIFRNRSYGSARRSREADRNSWSAKLEYGAAQRQPQMPDLGLTVQGHAEHIELAAMHVKQDTGLYTTIGEGYEHHQRSGSPTDSLRELVRKPDEAV
ncbi:Satratoxin biosynthesis SC1 cluster protein 4 [Pseudocercospora fuligena]|uniref:Satratoxin biosynthesis SC1 cluster protein 4 n=1 Tax=Pseudocercospora fuligena TaxID=685502 RepID=A0A8H6R5N6_9PEZI|nr:Satratoxin biosynthesis SC1 cluster protein 4 [Pseudocercospora fuligena]